ncbi:hypothetical protein CY34DRAFT_102479 [Suillus luteus UH-Slu-Lm8-n1]|uniref:CxC5 like cysteine cluster associated with KDZ domain-containing protein n=1 Tax=Suillus luteus UH-Slu-Lm8-n1 TaxID=930992 RepID=A0A0D0ACI7_9AGAM|nr:hypothetical protein CY34DRAFT_102479 [Suillus luteus UH-Slu-Lm8-n1]
MKLSYITFQRFLHCLSALKDDILQPQPHTVSVTAAPEVLPPVITEFLSESFHITLEAVDMLWDVVKEIVWVLLTKADERETVETMFRLHGRERGLTALVLYPPNKTCSNLDCTALQHGSLLKKEEQRRVVVFTHANNAQCAWSVHLKCRLCHSNYHHNYVVHSGFRHYYAGVLKYLQVGEHQFVQYKLGMQWMDLMQIAYVVRFYLH